MRVSADQQATLAAKSLKKGERSAMASAIRSAVGISLEMLQNGALWKGELRMERSILALFRSATFALPAALHSTRLHEALRIVVITHSLVFSFA